MRSFLKKDIIGSFKNIYEQHDNARKFIEKKTPVNAKKALTECKAAASDISEKTAKSEGESCPAVVCLNEYCAAVDETLANIFKETNGNKLRKQLDKLLLKAESSVKNDVKVKLEVVFMPYKASMWDSLESVWKAASDDSDCTAYVVPIPYYDRNPDGSFGEFHYEGDDYPEYVPVTHYDEYDLAARRPDVIYIHNPYDNYNYVTSVAPDFYSYELKKYTKCLVYVPYYISGHFGKTAVKNGKSFPCAYYADKVIVQSETQKKIFETGGISKDKLLLLGNPKSDFVINKYNSIKVPDEWLKTIQNRKAFLLNTSIAGLLKLSDWPKEMNKLIDAFADNKNAVLIWRPHPLLDSTAASMRPDILERYNSVCKRIAELDNAIIDRSPSPYSAVKATDAMISDYSSLIMTYSLTGKPVLVTVGSSDFRKKKAVCFDYFSNYFVKNGVTAKKFIDMVVSGSDDLFEERQKTVFGSLMNSDGTCGQKVHQAITEELLSE